MTGRPPRAIRGLIVGEVAWLGIAFGVALGVGGCGWLPADSPPAAPAPAPDPDAALFHDWKVAGHVLGGRARRTP